MSAAERASLQESNVTVGRQQWTEEGRMLGAGVGAGAAYTELGLSAKPAAMSHGVTMGAKPTIANQRLVVPTVAAPAGAVESTSQVTDPRHADTSRAPAVSTAQGQQQQQPQEYSTSDAAEADTSRSQAPSKAEINSAAASNIAGKHANQPAEAGRPQRVAPPDQQQSWSQTAWKWFKRIALGEGKDLLELGPPWTKWPDYSRLNNINALVLGLWPSVAEAVKQQIVMQMVPTMMDQAVKDYGAGYLTGLKLLEFDLGKDAPRIQGMKVYDEMGEEQLMLEVAAAWGSSCKVTVSAGLHILGRALTIPLTIQNIQFHCLARVTARPLLPHYPYVGAVGVSFIEPPHVNFELPVGLLGGLDVMALPGIYGAFRLATQLAARQYAVYPKGIQIPLVPGGAAAGGPTGMLEVKLVRLSGLRSEDLLGQSDPFVIFRLREGREIRSRTVNNNNNPEYNQSFRMLVDDPDTQVLQVIVMDEDLMSFQNKVIGVAQVPMKQAACLAMPRTKVPVTLQLHKLMGPQQGIGGVLELPIRVAGLPITAASTGGKWLYENITGALGVGGGKTRHKSSKGKYTEILDETGWLGPSEEYLEELGLSKEEATANAGQPQNGMGPGCAAGPEAAAAAAGNGGQPRQQQQQQPASPFSMASSSSTVSPIQQQQQHQYRAYYDPTAAVVRQAPRRPPSEGDAESWGSDTEADEWHSVSSRSSRTSTGIGGMSRLSSQSAPLTAVYTDNPPAAAGTAAAGGPAAGRAPPAAASAGGQEGQGDTEEQQQQQQEDERKEALQAAQEHIASGKDAKDLGGTQVKPVYRGTCYLELTYTPFRKPDIAPTGAGASPAAAGDVAAATGMGAVKPTDMGILAVTLIRAKGLSGWTGEADPYVTLTLMENAGVTGANAGGVGRLKQMEEFRSNTIYNEDSPRWNEKFDFIMVPASSVLLITVWDQTSVMESVASLSLSKERFKDHVMGRVKVPVLEVASAGRLHSTYALQGAMMGELELITQWIPAHLVE